MKARAIPQFSTATRDIPRTGAGIIAAARARFRCAAVRTEGTNGTQRDAAVLGLRDEERRKFTRVIPVSVGPWASDEAWFSIFHHENNTKIVGVK
jgi:hypothetical protein